MTRFWPRIAVLVACVTGVFLVAAGTASAHTLKVRTAKKAIKQVTAEWYFDSDLSGRYWVDNCNRRSDHRVNCLAHIRGRNTALGATETCTRKGSATLRGKTVRASLGSKSTCKFNYGDDEAPDVGTPPAPDTVITSGPEDGSTLNGADGPFSWEFQAIGGENPTFECSYDGGSWFPCSSGGNHGFEPGPHTFSVRALSTRLGAQQVPDPTPAARSFTVT